MNLKEATIRVVDFETTGFDPKEERVCEVGWVDIVYDDEHGWVIASSTKSQLCNPQKPIPAIASAVHHITDDMVEDQPSWLAPDDFVYKVFHADQNIDLFAAHNVEFDRAFAGAGDNWPWLCTYRLALHRIPDAPSYKNQVLKYHLGIHADGDAHRAGYDAECTARILMYMLNGAETELTVEGIVEYADRPVYLATKKVGFGKHKDALWSEVPISYLQWMKKQGPQSDTNPDGWDRDQWYTLSRILGA